MPRRYYVASLQKVSVIFFILLQLRHSERCWKQGREPLNSSSEADASQRYGSLSWELMIHDRLCIREVRLLQRKRTKQRRRKDPIPTEEEKPGLRSSASRIIEGSVNQYTGPRGTICREARGISRYNARYPRYN